MSLGVPFRTITLTVGALPSSWQDQSCARLGMEYEHVDLSSQPGDDDAEDLGGDLSEHGTGPGGRGRTAWPSASTAGSANSRRSFNDTG